MYVFIRELAGHLGRCGCISILFNNWCFLLLLLLLLLLYRGSNRTYVVTPLDTNGLDNEKPYRLVRMHLCMVL